MILRVFFLGKSSGDGWLWLQTQAGCPSDMFFFFFKLNGGLKSLSEHLNQTISQRHCLFVPVCAMKSFASVLKPHLRNRVLHLLVKPCQMLVCVELVQVGGMFALNYVQGIQKSLSNSPLLVFRTLNIGNSVSAD